VRAVLDPNVLISAVLRAGGAPAEVVRAACGGEFEPIVSPALIAELERALAYPRLRARVSVRDAAAYLAWLAELATRAEDPPGPPGVRSTDPGDDYLVALAAAERAALVSGDGHLLELADRIPVFTARRWLEALRRPPQPSRRP